MSPQVFPESLVLVLIQQVYLNGSSLGHLFRIFFSSNHDLRIRSCSNDVNTAFSASISTKIISENRVAEEKFFELMKIVIFVI